jgi:hypothetical protein
MAKKKISVKKKPLILESGSTSICEAAKTFSSSVWLKKKHVKNTGIHRYSDGGISVFGICDIDPLYYLQHLICYFIILLCLPRKVL